MMDPREWANPDGSVPPEIEELFQAARPTRRMTEAERLRSAAAVRAIAATPVPTWPAIVVKNISACILAISTMGIVVGGGSGIDTKRLEHEPQQPPISSEPVLVALGDDVYNNAGGRAEDPQFLAPVAPVVPVVPVAPVASVPPSPRLSPLKAKAKLAFMPLDGGERRSIFYRHPAEGSTKQERPIGIPPAVSPPLTDVAAATNVPTNKADTDEDTLARELALIEKAKAALGTNPTETLNLLDKYPKEFPAGRHGFTREVLTIDALLKIGRKAQARSRAEALLPRVKGTPFEMRVQKQIEEAK